MSDTQVFGELISQVTSTYDARWNDAGSGAARDGGFWHPRPQGEFRPLGSVGVGFHQDINGSYLALLVAANPNAVQEADADGIFAWPVASPIGYTQVWKDDGSKANENGSFWRPVPPIGYVSLGDVALGRWSPPPSVNDVWCLRRDLAVASTFGSENIWNDKKSGSKSDVSVWEIQTHFTGNAPDLLQLGAIRANESYEPPGSQFAFRPKL